MTILRFPSARTIGASPARPETSARAQAGETPAGQESYALDRSSARLLHAIRSFQTPAIEALLHQRPHARAVLEAFRRPPKSASNRDIDL